MLLVQALKLSVLARKLGASLCYVVGTSTAVVSTRSLRLFVSYDLVFAGAALLVRAGAAVQSDGLAAALSAGSPPGVG